jgi:MFS transporter, ACS family, D-galactonate transporter
LNTSGNAVYFQGHFVANVNPTPETTSPGAASFALPAGVTNARRWTVVWLLFLASLINYLDRSTISFALPLISRDLHLGPETKGLLLSAFFWSYALMQVPIGLMSDRLNLRWVYAGAFALWSLAQGLTGLAGSLVVLVLLRIVLGVGESIYFPGSTKIVSLLYGPRERGLPSGLFDFGTRLGLVMGGLFIPWLLSRFGWRTTFLYVGLCALLWLIPWLAVFPSGVSGRKPPSGGEQRPRAFSFRKIARFDRNLLGMCLGFFCFDYFWYLLVTWLPDYLFEVRGFSILKAGFYTALPFAVFGLSEPLGGWIADLLIRRGWDETRTRKGIVTVGFLFGLLLIPAARVSSAGAAVALFAAASLVGLATGNLIVILQCCAPPEEVGVWTGFENFAGNVGGVIAPLATGFLVARTHSFVAAFALGPILLIIGLFAYWLIVGELKAPPASPTSRLP